MPPFEDRPGYAQEMYRGQPGYGQAVAGARKARAGGRMLQTTACLGLLAPLRRHRIHSSKSFVAFIGAPDVGLYARSAWGDRQWLN